MYHQVLNYNKPMTLADKSDREALAPQFSDLKQRLMSEVNGATVANEGMRAPSAGVRLESKARSEEREALSPLNSRFEKEAVVPEPKTSWFVSKVKALFAPKQPEKSEALEELKLSEQFQNEKKIVYEAKSE